ncbi:MAG: hypothetical protein WBH98_01235 [Bacteroidales bacterium]
MKTFGKLTLIGLLAMFLFSACEPDEDDTTLDARDKYVGQWHFYEYSKSSLNQSYIVVITKDATDENALDLANLGNPGIENISTKGVLVGSKIVVHLQPLPNNWEIEGEGSMSNIANTQMQWRYTITAGGNRISYNITATKQ